MLKIATDDAEAMPQHTAKPDDPESNLLRIMIDLETFDLEPSAKVWEIGAVVFDPTTAQLGDEFHWLIDPTTQHNRTTSQHTLDWWAKQPPEAYLRVRQAEEEGLELEAVLLDLELWIKRQLDEAGEGTKLEVWANSPSFDLAILKHAYQQLGRGTPWKFWQERDHRTLKNLRSDIKVERQGIHHSAQDDAAFQAKQANAIIKFMRLI
ncbi:protein of unknown function [Marinospirillum celere]|uniref:3'-5' exoribonuclease Rv2179c-like domain-containing protein n=1 Tax=Marinospirillum celere TaxID=1122252 RepID=A0A1I1E0A4_9GAMM|nr:3'-5' exonuclease [Marinospirillum celere]SFB80096.1 protein of unknown function [Marinospirillum celere]